MLNFAFWNAPEQAHSLNSPANAKWPQLPPKVAGERPHVARTSPPYTCPVPGTHNWNASSSPSNLQPSQPTLSTELIKPSKAPHRTVDPQLTSHTRQLVAPQLTPLLQSNRQPEPSDFNLVTDTSPNRKLLTERRRPELACRWMDFWKRFCGCEVGFVGVKLRSSENSNAFDCTSFDIKIQKKVLVIVTNQSQSLTHLLILTGYSVTNFEYSITISARSPCKSHSVTNMNIPSQFPSQFPSQIVMVAVPVTIFRYDKPVCLY